MWKACCLLLPAPGWTAVSYYGVGHKGGTDLLANLPWNPLVMTSPDPGEAIAPAGSPTELELNCTFLLESALTLDCWL